ncbi:MAG: anhydro-N-acetylmuramic acid kinase [Bacteroidales bacterium]|nr:anhydro-N-acetylmuramic acid kinase [Bacteroidales bacterium]
MKYHVIGLMSGTSLDGADIVYCTFSYHHDIWKYQIHQAETIPYSGRWHSRLRDLEKGSAFDFAKTDMDFGHLLGSLTQEFINRHELHPDFIASHGHTIFHQPGVKLTSQIGHGSAIAAETGLPVICDFRSLDVALGGQGAPLVPIGDRLLFGEFGFCLNLGGFANISRETNKDRIAYDICPVNIVLNALAEKLGHPFDRDGSFARMGSVNPALLEALNKLPFYSRRPPKSLGKEWVIDQIWPLITAHYQNIDLHTDARGQSPVSGETTNAIHDILATWCEHTAIQVGKAVMHPEKTNLRPPEIDPVDSISYNKETVSSGDRLLLITGGGALNQYLIDRITRHTRMKIIIPDPVTINFKEALIFALLGTLRWRQEINCLKSVTGASKDNIGGAIYFHKV